MIPEPREAEYVAWMKRLGMGAGLSEGLRQAVLENWAGSVAELIRQKQEEAFNEGVEHAENVALDNEGDPYAYNPYKKRIE